MKNKDGFTIMELLVCIVIVAILMVTVGLNANKMFDKSDNNRYKDLMLEVFNAASSYVELSTVNCNITSGCNVTIKNLVDKGLLEDTIYDKSIPIYKDGRKFDESTSVNVKKTSGVKDVTLTCSNRNYTLTLSNIEEYNDHNKWRNC